VNVRQKTTDLKKVRAMSAGSCQRRPNKGGHDYTGGGGSRLIAKPELFYVENTESFKLRCRRFGRKSLKSVKRFQEDERDPEEGKLFRSGKVLVRHV